MKTNRNILVLLLVFWAFASRANTVMDFPGLDEMIHEADAIVVLRVDRLVSKENGSSDLYKTYDCLILQTLKGNIPKDKTIRLQLLDTCNEFISPFAEYSTHLMFLTKKMATNEPTDYRTIEITGANIRLTPFGQEKTPKGKTIKDQITSLLKTTIEYNQQQGEMENRFLKQMIDENSAGKANDNADKKYRNRSLFVVLGEATNYVVNWNQKQSLFPCLQGLEPMGKWRSQPVVLVRNGTKSSFRLGEAGATNIMGPGLLVGDIICLGGKKPIDYNANSWAAPEPQPPGSWFEQNTNETERVILLLGGKYNGVMRWKPDLTLYYATLLGGGSSSYHRTFTLLRNGEVTNFRRRDIMNDKGSSPKLLPWDIVYVGRTRPFKF